MSIHAIIPARGGSKRIPRKNLAVLAGHPLLAWTIASAREFGDALALSVSTEDDEIAAVARAYGANVIKRPLALAADTASTEGVLTHAFDVLGAGQAELDWVLCLPPTSPFRSTTTLSRFLELSSSPSEATCLLSVTETRGDFWRPRAEGKWERLFPDAPRRQQDRAPLFEENSAYYLSRISSLRSTGSILGQYPVGIPIPAVEGFDINTAHDLALAEAMISAGLVSKPRSLR